jgi:hypothetical protein
MVFKEHKSKVHQQHDNRIVFTNSRRRITREIEETLSQSAGRWEALTRIKMHIVLAMVRS